MHEYDHFTLSRMCLRVCVAAAVEVAFWMILPRQ
jgi:hypothetical protein